MTQLSTTPAADPSLQHGSSRAPGRRLAGNSERRVAVVTGGTSGIGAAIATRLQEDGMRVVVTGRRAAPDAPARRDDADPQRLQISADLTTPGAAEDVVDAVMTRFGRLDVLVNNAGRRHSGSVVDTTPDDIAAVFALNTFAAMAMTAAVVPAMIAQHDGAVVNMVSRLATVGVRDLTTYSASKGALLAYTRGAAIELAEHNIRVNAVAPGMTHTPLIESWLADQPDPQAAIEDVVADIPLHRLALSEDVAGAVAYLASADATYLTGVCLPVDGGYTAR